MLDQANVYWTYTQARDYNKDPACTEDTISWDPNETIMFVDPVPHGHYATCEKVQEYLAAAGLVADPAGGDTVVSREWSVPGLYRVRFCHRTLRERDVVHRATNEEISRYAFPFLAIDDHFSLRDFHNYTREVSANG
jgi:hypothetical protein